MIENLPWPEVEIKAIRKIPLHGINYSYPTKASVSFFLTDKLNLSSTFSSTLYYIMNELVQ